tara:strand:+ start:499 stop:1200 length:702 start_codon:yes stop_codon:yes gene_type:complete
MKLFSTKKAQEGITLTQAIGIVLAIIAILALTFLIVKVSAPFFGRQAYDATKNNFDELTDRVQEMLEKDGLIIERFFPYYIGEDYALMAFGKEDTIEAVYGKQLTLLKPDLCAGKACLCFYKDIVGQNGLKPLTILETKDGNVLHCKSFEGDITFFTIEKKTSPLQLFIGGELSTTPPTFHPGAKYLYIAQSSGITKGIQNFYMEKFENNNKIYFYITTEDKDTQSRSITLES